MTKLTQAVLTGAIEVWAYRNMGTSAPKRSYSDEYGVNLEPVPTMFFTESIVVGVDYRGHSIMAQTGPGKPPVFSAPWRNAVVVPRRGRVAKKRGRKPKADYDAYYEAFVRKIAEDGFPDHLNVDGWSKQRDVEHWIESLAQQDGVDLQSTACRRRAKEFMDRYEAEAEKDPN